MAPSTTPFPSATILAYPRVGRGRELKRALEAHWAGRTTAEELAAAHEGLRRANLARLVELGLGAGDASLAHPPYDDLPRHDATVLLGAVPPRFAGRSGLDLYFALARGDAGAAPQEMTKWFDTNYHYLVPEIGPDTPISFADDTVVRRYAQAADWGYVTRPVLVGPVTYLALAKADTAGYDPLDRPHAGAAAYPRAPGAPPAGGGAASWVAGGRRSCQRPPTPSRTSSE